MNDSHSQCNNWEQVLFIVTWWYNRSYLSHIDGKTLWQTNYKYEMNMSGTLYAVIGLLVCFVFLTTYFWFKGEVWCLFPWNKGICTSIPFARGGLYRYFVALSNCYLKGVSSPVLPLYCLMLWGWYYNMDVENMMLYNFIPYFGFFPWSEYRQVCSTKKRPENFIF